MQTAFAISPDGQLVAGIGPDQKGYLYPSAGGDPRIVNGMEPGDLPISLESGRSLHLSVPDRRSAGQGLPVGISHGKENGLEADCSARSHRRLHHRTHPDDTGREDVRLRFPSNPRRPLSGRRPEVGDHSSCQAKLGHSTFPNSGLPTTHPESRTRCNAFVLHGN